MTPDQKAEIDALRAQSFTTRRATVPALEEILYDAIPILDHGFIRVIDYMGDDAAVVQAARVSYGKGTKKVREDAGLIAYLMRHRHSTPFEMCEIKFHVKLPIFVARQWIRHRTANVNEYSARYSILDREFYVPKPEHMAAQSSSNRQGRGDVLPADKAAAVMKLLRDDAERSYDHYLEMLGTGDERSEEDRGLAASAETVAVTGLARELARMNLSLNFYTQWYWKTDLHNFMHFLSLRADPHAQYEIRVYAEAMADVLARWVPATYDAFTNYRLGGALLSAKALAVVKAMLDGQAVDKASSGMSAREWAEVMATLGRTTL
jgi:thymidylate synthase (FAD)